MGRPHLLVMLVSMTVVSVVAAAVIPVGAYASDIFVVEQAFNGEPTELKVEVDGDRFIVHAPEGYVVREWGQERPPPRVTARLQSTVGRGSVIAIVESGHDPSGERVGVRDGRAVWSAFDGHGVVWEVVSGALLFLRSSGESIETLLAMIDDLEKI